MLVRSALRARLPYAAPGCSQSLGGSEHIYGMSAQQEDSVGFDPRPFNTCVSRGLGSTTDLSPTPVVYLIPITIVISVIVVHHLIVIYIDILQL